ncbi:exosome complex component Csl4p [Trichomonascus vanleenenianus]|uniref:exosome non-catalytic core subunit CSL4 n=1 Tax=Trichomonascus vanleenenianus TaxID=2268995 RepID=UPI003EC98511
MTVPGYVVPGQIICPLIEKDNNVFRKYSAGRGAVVSKIANGVEAITSTVVGKVSIEQANASNDSVEGNDSIKKKKSESSHFVVNVENKFKNSYAFDPSVKEKQKVTRTSTSVLPEVGDVVLARVTRLTLRQVHLEILVVENQGAVAADSGLGMHGAGEGIVPSSNATGHSASGLASSAGDAGEGFGGIIRLQDVRATERDSVKILSSFRPGDIVRASVISLGDGTNYYLSTASNDLGVIFARSVTGQHMYPIDWQTMKCSVTGIEEPRKCAKPF